MVNVIRPVRSFVGPGMNPKPDTTGTINIDGTIDLLLSTPPVSRIDSRTNPPAGGTPLWSISSGDFIRLSPYDCPINISNTSLEEQI